jgi:transposase
MSHGAPIYGKEPAIMRKLEIGEAEVMRIAIRQEIDRSIESRYDHRLHGVLLVCKGMSCCTVADLLDQDARTVERWVTRFNTRGFAGLSEGERPGRPRRLTDDQWTRLGADLRKSPQDFHYGSNLWDGPLLSHHLAKRYGIRLGVRQCQRLFRQMGFRLRKPRGVIDQGDPAAQAAYKKTLSPRPRRRH